MPPKVRFDKEQILSAAYQLVEKNGMDALNARALAQQLGCSTQPLFRIFSSMDEIRTQVILMAQKTYLDTVEECHSAPIPPYKRTGMAYLRYARQHPRLFMLLFMQEVHEENSPFTDAITAPAITAICASTGYDQETALRFHQHMWIFTHGLASMIATRSLLYDEETASQLLSECYMAARAQYDAKYPNKTAAHD